MRSCLTICIFLLFWCPGKCQSTSTTVATPEEIILNTITSGIFEGTVQKQLGIMGDAVGVTLTKVLSERSLSANEIEMVLVILRSSFADPKQVQTPRDREPRTELFVLDYLAYRTPDPGIKKEIAETKAYLREQFTKYQKAETDSHSTR
jgi:hypothetical protein